MEIGRVNNSGLVQLSTGETKISNPSNGFDIYIAYDGDQIERGIPIKPGCSKEFDVAVWGKSNSTHDINAVIDGNGISAPIITEQPTNLVVDVGESGSLSVSVTNEGTYQWFKDGEWVAGGTSATLDFVSLTGEDAGEYFCRITKNDYQIDTNVVIVYPVAANLDVTFELGGFGLSNIMRCGYLRATEGRGECTPDNFTSGGNSFEIFELSTDIATKQVRFIVDDVTELSRNYCYFVIDKADGGVATGRLTRNAASNGYLGVNEELWSAIAKLNGQTSNVRVAFID